MSEDDDQRLKPYLKMERLPELLTLDTLTWFQLDKVNFLVMSNTLKDPDGTADRLHEVLELHDGKVTGAVHRVAIELVDARWRTPGQMNDKARAVRRELDFLRQKFGRIPAVLLYEGALAHRNQDREAAFALFRQAAEEMGDHLLPRMYVGAYSLRTVDDSDWADVTPSRIIGSTPDIDWRRPPEKRSNICLYLAGDGNYFDTFARALYDDARRIDDACNVHFHVVNWNDTSDSQFDGVDDPLLSISVEDYRYRRDHTYFALARFYRAAKVMERLDLPLYISDLDNVVSAPLSKAVADLADYDACFGNQSNQAWFPWWGPTAWNTYVNTTPNGRQLATWMHDYSVVRFTPNDGRKSWWFDQLMLNEVEHRAKTDGMAVTSSRQPHLTLTRGRPHAEIAHLKAKR
ncbi:hypothetical protein DXV76_18610 [Rhodobacteraceae bacterium CCMM004]|nr:hypothetical protein DXV76_18610 [Rhodobacteraceae bacterium CCMM004]